MRSPVKYHPKTLGLCIATFIAATSGVASASSSPGRSLVSGVSAMAAPTVHWAEWTAPSSTITGLRYNYANSLDGEITMPDGSTVYLKFSGEIIQAGDNTSRFDLVDDAYWRARPYSRSGGFFISDNVPSLPTNGDNIGMVGDEIAAQSLEFFSDAARLTPANVTNIVMNIYSVGGATEDIDGQWDFDNDFVILKSNGPTDSNGAYGLARTEVTGPPVKYSLAGKEGTGQLQFPGTYNSIKWTIVKPEAFATWNIGVTSFVVPGAPITAAFDTQGGSSIASVETTSGGTLSDPGTPTKDGFSFDGWYTESSGGTKATFPYSHGQGANFTLYAKWTPVETTTTSTALSGESDNTGRANGAVGSTNQASTEDLPAAGSSWGLLLAAVSLVFLVGGLSVSRREKTHKGWA